MIDSNKEKEGISTMFKLFNIIQELLPTELMFTHFLCVPRNTNQQEQQTYQELTQLFYILISRTN